MNVWRCVFIAFSVCISGCQPQKDSLGTVQAQQGEDKGVRQREEKDAEAIKIADLLDALQMQIWTGSVNQHGDEPVNKVSLCVKPKASDPKTVLTTDLTDDGQPSPGELVVFLQEVEGQRYKVGMVFRATNDRRRLTIGFMDDPFVDVVGVEIAHSSAGSVWRPGITVLRWADSGGLNIETQKEAVGVYLKYE